MSECHLSPWPCSFKNWIKVLLSHILSTGNFEDLSAFVYLACIALLHKCIDSWPQDNVNGLEQNLKYESRYIQTIKGFQDVTRNHCLKV